MSETNLGQTTRLKRKRGSTGLQSLAKRVKVTPEFERLSPDVLRRTMLSSLRDAASLGTINWRLLALYNRDEFWQHPVPANQRVLGRNKVIFQSNLRKIQSKLKIKSLINSQDETLKLCVGLTADEIQQLLFILPHLHYKKIEFPRQRIWMKAIRSAALRSVTKKT